MSEIKQRLLPCPFCGGEAEFPIRDGSWLWCKECGAETSYCYTREEAIEKWNTRKPMERIIERLEECEEELKGLQYKSVNSYGYYNQRKGIELAKDIVKEEGGIE